MPTKEKLIEFIDSRADEVISKGEVKHLINSVKTQVASDVSYIKKGDVITVAFGVKKRPAAVAKVKKDTVIAIPLSTTEDELTLCRSSSRFFRDGYFSKGLIEVKKTVALETFIGTYDNPKLLNKAIRLIKAKMLEDL